jgi:muramoyltetrapeptide carboxypeptidase
MSAGREFGATPSASSRRRFVAKAAAMFASGLLVPAFAANAGPAGTRGLRRSSLRLHERRPLLRPPRLQARALVGLVAPGGVLDDAIIETCVRNLESVGFSVRLGRNIRAARGGYAGSVEQRVDDLHTMFGDRDVQAIWTARGGSGCTALLPYIDYAYVRQHPKILLGYSDVTALHLALFRQAGLVSFHGPVAWSTFSSYSVEHMLAVLMSPQREHAMPPAGENREKGKTQQPFAARTIRGGVATGRLIGGNLSIVAALAGTPFSADFRSRLLFLEDVGEPPYRIDRMLTQLDQNVGFARAAGILLGIFQKSAPPDRDPSVTLDDVLDDHFAKLRAPAVYGWSFGHVPHQMTLPVGVRARMDTATETLTLLEPAVS